MAAPQRSEEEEQSRMKSMLARLLASKLKQIK
jgi:hypothetical protein